MVHTVHCAFDPAAYGFYEQFRDAVGYVSISDFQRTLGPAGMRWAATVYNALPVDGWPYRERKDDYLLAFGRVCEDKGFHLAIEVARRTGSRLLMAGVVQEWYRDYFEQRIAPEIDDEQIVYLGEVSDAQKRELFAGARAFVFPILWPEPFGIVMIEAMAAGTPVDRPAQRLGARGRAGGRRRLRLRRRRRDGRRGRPPRTRSTRPPAGRASPSASASTPWPPTTRRCTGASRADRPRRAPARRPRRAPSQPPPSLRRDVGELRR